jgi:Xaa-Pro aminopeptidase
MHLDRFKKLYSNLKNPILIKKKENLLYLTGQVFDNRTEEYLLVLPKGRGGNVVAFGSGLEKISWAKKVDRLKNISKYVASGKLDIEWGFTFAEAEYLKFKAPKLKIKPEKSLVDFQRQIKDSSELLKIKKSMQIVEAVFKLVRKEIKKPGITEIKLAKFIESNGLKMGAENVSFPAIVASGANAAVPHHVPSTKKIKVGESIILDFGFKYKNYCSDFTRTVFLKKVGSKKIEQAYNQVEKAYCKSMDFSSFCVIPDYDPGSRKWMPNQVRHDRNITGNDLYQKAVDVLKEKDLDKYFIHSLGHGTGLEIHELPNLSPNSKDILQDNMVFSIEPGVYLPRLGGIRIEDLVYLKKGEVQKFIFVPTDLKSNIL